MNPPKPITDKQKQIIRENKKNKVALPKKVREQWDEGQTKFYEWESDIYGQHTTLSDDDKGIWVEGYLYAKREEIK